MLPITILGIPDRPWVAMAMRVTGSLSASEMILTAASPSGAVMYMGTPNPPREFFTYPSNLRHHYGND
tara:strand:+ start:324 stop:527 length:204 start_codon:yes stop_codon:yes gene_type:complete